MERLKKYGFTNKKKVIDVGCGVGQWTTALASLNEFVVGIDPNSTRLFIANHIAESQKMRNIRYVNQSTNQIDQIDEQKYDCIFCFGVFMFTDKKSTLKKFYEITDGKSIIFINFNNFGWWLKLIIERGIKKRELRVFYMLGIELIRSIYSKKHRIFLTNNSVRKLVTKNGFEIIYEGNEGDNEFVMNNGNNFTKYDKHYFHLPLVTEMIIRKKSQ